MFFSDLALDQFRSYDHQVVQFATGAQALIGLNGQGKTNLVEAIAYLATFSSHRVAADTALVKAGESAAVIRAKVQDGDRSLMLEVEILAGKANRARLNRTPVKTRELLGIVHCVIFAPEDLILVKGDPSDRRRFLDDLLVQFSPRLGGVKTDYDRVLRQRSALLKSAFGQQRAGRSPDLSTLDVWDEQIADLGAQIIVARADMVAELQPLVEAAYDEVASGQSTAAISIKSSLGEVPLDELRDLDQMRQRLASALVDNRAREIERGVTSAGPHRDDLVLTLNELPARGYASHGESWSFALALRLASYELLRARNDSDGRTSPILILDDVFAELDASRQRRLAAMVAGAEQVFVTAAVPSDVPEELDAQRYTVANSVVSIDES